VSRIPPNPCFAVALCLAFPILPIRAAAPDKVHPAYNLVNLRAPDWLPNSVTGLAWLGPDTLVVAEFGGVSPEEKSPMRKGALHLLTGVMKAKGPGDVQRVTIAQGLAQPMGAWVKDGAIYLHEKGDLGTEIWKVSKSGGQWKHELFAKGWGAEEGYMWHSWPGGLVFQNGYWNFNVTSFLANSYKGVVFNGKRWPPTERGAWIRLDPVTKQYKVMASGMRTNESTWLGPWGGLFTVDVQGDWMPDNKLIELHEGRFYGHNYGPAAAQEESPPMCYMPQGDASNSPGEGVYLKKGPFKGQLLVAEQTYGGINRYSLERINGELQACVFDFGGTPRAAPYSGAHSQRIIAGPDEETLYYGCAGGWWVAGPELGSIAKLEPSGKMGFDMLAIRSTGPTGFDIEFTLPVGPALAALPASYAVETYTRRPEEGYGLGSRVGRRILAVKSARVADAQNRVVHLEFNAGDLSTGTVRLVGSNLVGIGYTVGFDLKALRSAGGEALFDTKAYYTLNQFGPGTVPVPGCMVKGDARYDPAANDPYAELCSGTTAAKPMQASAPVPDAQASRSEGRILRIRFAAPGSHALRIFDTAARLVYDSPRLDGPEFSLRLGKPGIYLIRLEGPEGATTQEIPVP
jgi:hypothetical protein